MVVRWLPAVRHLALAGLLAAGLSACGASSDAVAPAASSAGSVPRPSSPAVLTIVQPANGEQVTGPTVHVVVSLAHARVVAATTTHIRPDEGHVHLYLDNTLVYMQYSLQQDLPVPPGTHVLRAEFVASDHVPFDPRVWSESVIFTVK